jgi:hypothetical protein
MVSRGCPLYGTQVPVPSAGIESTPAGLNPQFIGYYLVGSIASFIANISLLLTIWQTRG